MCSGFERIIKLTQSAKFKYPASGVPLSISLLLAVVYVAPPLTLPLLNYNIYTRTFNYIFKNIKDLITFNGHIHNVTVVNLVEDMCFFFYSLMHRSSLMQIYLHI